MLAQLVPLILRNETVLHQLVFDLAFLVHKTNHGQEVKSGVVLLLCNLFHQFLDLHDIFLELVNDRFVKSLNKLHHQFFAIYSLMGTTLVGVFVEIVE